MLLSGTLLINLTLLKLVAYNKRMLHQPLRGLDGFSARASLQNRRKYGRYVK